jgi:threonine dehydratase
MNMESKDFIACHEKIKPYIHKTPVLTSRLIDEIVGAKVFFKCENFQRMGSFKMRGATNAILQLSEEELERGVVAHSSGNFAQAVALAAREVGTKATIVMPANAPEVKKAAVRDYGGLIVECESTAEAREREANRVKAEQGSILFHPSNQIEVIVGQGTAFMELNESHPDLDAVFVPVGGGGLIAGTALAAHYFSNNCTVIGGEPEEADDAYRSLISGKIEKNVTANTIADGLRTNLGSNNFPVIQKHVEKIVRVSENEIIESLKLIWERMKIVCEPSCSVAFAALLREKEQFAGKKIGVIISGGNIDLAKLPF